MVKLVIFYMWNVKMNFVFTWLCTFIVHVHNKRPPPSSFFFSSSFFFLLLLLLSQQQFHKMIIIIYTIISFTGSVILFTRGCSQVRVGDRCMPYSNGSELCYSTCAEDGCNSSVEHSPLTSLVVTLACLICLHMFS